MINYYLLTKPGIIFGNLVTLAAGFLLGSQLGFNLPLFLATLLGLACIIAAACVFNNYIDRTVDQKMERTKWRALARGAVGVKSALTFAALLLSVGCLILFLLTNLLALTVALLGFLIYVFPYSLWKCRTSLATGIGSLAGATPPVVGYCAASGRFDMAALILFFILVFWQMPHFFAIALYRLEDYSRAGIPVLPVFKGAFRTKVHMTLYICLFIPLALMLSFLNYTGVVYFYVLLGLSLLWLALSLKGFSSKNDVLWGRQMFVFSLIVIGALCFIIPLDLHTPSTHARALAYDQGSAPCIQAPTF